jgi:hypothetical protein
MANNYGTPWRALGTLDATASAADATLAVAERFFQTVKDLDNVVWAQLDNTANGIEVRFKMTTDGANAAYIDVWAGRFGSGGGPNADAELTRICTLDVECGLQDTLDGAAHFADEITLTNGAWLKTPEVINSANDTNVMARLFIPDMCGYDLLLFHGYGAGMTEDTEVEIAGWQNTFDIS